VRTRALVQDAVRDLFEREGAGGLTHQRVAERAGVSRATVYRHWPQPLDLVVEALGVASQPLLHPSEDQPLREWLRRELVRVAADFARPVVRQFIATIVGDDGRSEIITELVTELTRRTVGAVREAFDRAEAEGAVFRRREEYQLVAELVGPVIVQVTMYRMPPDEQWLARLVDVAVDDRCAALPEPALGAAPWLLAPARRTNGADRTGLVILAGPVQAGVSGRRACGRRRRRRLRHGPRGDRRTRRSTPLPRRAGPRAWTPRPRPAAS
jgi:AcrR family transcriptional regulator